MKVLLPTAKETHLLGRCLGRVAPMGLVCTAHGDLGAGKTTLAQGIARGLNVAEDHYVNSPTFAIAQVHPGRFPFYHLDLYRLGDVDEAWGIGLDEMVGTDGVCYIEWASRCPELLPDDRLVIRFVSLAESRIVKIEATGPDAQGVLEQVCILAHQSGIQSAT